MMYVMSMTALTPSLPLVGRADDALKQRSGSASKKRGVGVGGRRALKCAPPSPSRGGMFALTLGRLP